jgi:hypothetical protein
VAWLLLAFRLFAPSPTPHAGEMLSATAKVNKEPQQMKKIAISLAACLLLATAGQAFAGRSDYFGKTAPPKDIKNGKPQAGASHFPQTQAGGETFATATVIPSLPYSDVGNTCGHTDDVFPPCAFAGISTAPDVVYTYTPTTDQCVNMVLCNSSYDTILHVYDQGFNLVDCNDDFCGLQSTLQNVPLVGGVKYYIVVDGYSVSCGDYQLDVTACPPPCSSSCPPGAIAENEPSCGPDYNDVTNGGCNSTPPVFTNLECNELGVQVCGTYGTYTFQGSSFRDTDWYQFTCETAKAVNFCVCGSQPTQIAILDANQGCDLTTLVCGSEFGDPGQLVCCNAVLPAGTYWLFVGTDGFSGIPCGSPYLLTLDGLTCPPVATTPASWTHMKSIYR